MADNTRRQTTMKFYTAIQDVDYYITARDLRNATRKLQHFFQSDKLYTEDPTYYKQHLEPELKDAIKYLKAIPPEQFEAELRKHRKNKELKVEEVAPGIISVHENI